MILTHTKNPLPSESAKPTHESCEIRMKVIKTIREMQEWSDAKRCSGAKIAVVPTMGYLHEGHLSLIDTARKNGADAVIVTIFVNPTQFGPNEDFDKYPRDFERDSKLCESKQVDVIFAPEAAEMYPSDSSTWVTEEKLSQGLCAKTRPTHFRGVTTVVSKLFLATLPHIAVFGQKDGQQARIIKRMVRDLNFPINIVISPIIRESDGLALSSRNRYLSEEEHRNALAISRGLVNLKSQIESGRTDLAALLAELKTSIEAASGTVDYIEAVDAETLEPITKIGGSMMFPVAAYFGKTRLIDNILVER